MSERASKRRSAETRYSSPNDGVRPPTYRDVVKYGTPTPPQSSKRKQSEKSSDVISRQAPDRIHIRDTGTYLNTNNAYLPEYESAGNPQPWKSNKLGRVANEDRVSRDELPPGRLIWAPWHVTAFKPEGENFLIGQQHDEGEKEAEQSKKRKCPFVQANYAVICSKRRMFCVYYTTPHSLQAFPMFTHKHKGLKAVRAGERKYRIPVKDSADDPKWKEPSKFHKAVTKLEGSDDCQMKDYTIIDYTKSYPIELSEFIEVVGRLTAEGTDYVIEQNEQLRGRDDRRNTVSGDETGGILRRLGIFRSLDVALRPCSGVVGLSKSHYIVDHGMDKSLVFGLCFSHGPLSSAKMAEKHDLRRSWQPHAPRYVRKSMRDCEEHCHVLESCFTSPKQSTTASVEIPEHISDFSLIMRAGAVRLDLCHERELWAAEMCEREQVGFMSRIP